MRTTLSIEDELLAAIKSLAQARSTSIGEVVSDLIRKGLQASNRIRSKNDIPVFKVSSNAKPISLEDVKKIEDEL